MNEDTKIGVRGDPAADLPEFVGKYRILRQIGEGGMGRVFLAEQSEPFVRKVALKILHPGIDTEEIVARFRAEQQTLARLAHPNIARVLDAGDTDDGQPYFVMEYVDGRPIDEVAADPGVPTSTLLDLVAQACDGIQHAHQKGLIHRDIKPANLLVFSAGEALRLKVIDFGIARAIEGSLVDDSLATRVGQPVGTLSYMSPEQAGAIDESVDTRSDIYSLGVTLFQLFSGSLPLNPTTAGLATFLRELGDTDQHHVSPSRKTEQVRPAFAHRRKTLTTDLDAIILKAIEKSPERRYQSIGAFSADLRRYLRHEPVSARIPGNWYLIRKFVQRQTGIVVGSALALLALIVGMIMTAAALEQSREANAVAQREAATATAVADFLIDIMDKANPFQSEGTNPTLKDVVDAGAAEIENQFVDEPRVKTRILGVLGDTYAGLSDYTRALPLLDEAVEIATIHEVGDDLLADLLLIRSQVRRKNSQFEDALADVERALELDPQPSPVLDEDWRLKLARERAIILDRTGDHDQAAQIFSELVANYEALGADYEEELSSALNSLGAVLYRLGGLDESLEVFDRSLDIKRQILEPTAPALATTLGNIGNVELAAGNPERALELYEEAYEINLAAFGSEHTAIADSLGNMAQIHEALGNVEATRESYAQAVAIAEKIHGTDHLETAFWRFNQATFLLRQGEAQRALVDFAFAADRFQADVGENHFYTLAAVSELAKAQEQTGDATSAIANTRRALSIAEAVSGPDSDEVNELRERLDVLTNGSGYPE